MPEYDPPDNCNDLQIELEEYEPPDSFANLEFVLDRVEVESITTVVSAAADSAKMATDADVFNPANLPRQASATRPRLEPATTETVYSPSVETPTSVGTDVSTSIVEAPTVSPDVSVDVGAERQLAISPTVETTASTETERVLEDRKRATVGSSSSVSGDTSRIISAVSSADSSVVPSQSVSMTIEAEAHPSVGEGAGAALTREVVHDSQSGSSASSEAQLNKLDKFDQLREKHDIDEPRKVIAALI